MMMIFLMVFWEMGMKKRFELQMLSGWGNIWGDPWQCTFSVVAQFFFTSVTNVNWGRERKLHMQESWACIIDRGRVVHIYDSCKQYYCQKVIYAGSWSLHWRSVNTYSDDIVAVGNWEIEIFLLFPTWTLCAVFCWWFSCAYNRNAQSMMIFNDGNSEGDYNGDDYNDGDYNGDD